MGIYHNASATPSPNKLVAALKESLTAVRTLNRADTRDADTIVPLANLLALDAEHSSINAANALLRTERTQLADENARLRASADLLRKQLDTNVKMLVAEQDKRRAAEGKAADLQRQINGDTMNGVAVFRNGEKLIVRELKHDFKPGPDEPSCFTIKATKVPRVAGHDYCVNTDGFVSIKLGETAKKPDPKDKLREVRKQYDGMTRKDIPIVAVLDYLIGADECKCA